MPCSAPLSARTPPCGGFFAPFCRPQPRSPAVLAPPPRCFPGKTPSEAAVSASQPPGFPGFRPALRPCCRPKRARCASFPGDPALFSPRQPGFFPLCARALPAITPVLRPRSPRASQPPALGVRRRPELSSRWGFRPARLHRFAVVKRVPPQGGLNPWERFSGDRRPVSREFSRNSGPGVITKK